MDRVSKPLCVIGCVLLLVTAVFHGTGYSAVTDAVFKSNHPAMLKAALPGMWLHFSIHLVVLSALALFASFSARGSRGLLLLISVAVATDTILVWYYVGFFAGVALLVAAAVCFALAALRPSREPGLRGNAV